MAQGVYKITEAFEKAISKYTKAPYVVCIDNASNALFLCLVYEGVKGKTISIPSHTYPSVPCEIIHAGGKVKFRPHNSELLTGAYLLGGTRIVDSALRFTYEMYDECKGQFVCVSFSGPYKHLPLGKGGAILTDDKKAYEWFKRARFSGRNECNYNEDNLDMIGWNFYMLPEISAKGLRDMAKFYDAYGAPIPQEDKSLRYPDLSKFPIYTKSN
jgi:dTDP-4-amino-4,6-dideoxygalactose transaminase